MLPPSAVLPILPVDCPTDIVFVVDDSESLGSGGFSTMKWFLSQVASRLDIDSGRTRVGLVTFATNVGTVFNLNVYSSVASLQSAILSLSYTGGGTGGTGAALQYVRTRMLKLAAGNRINIQNTVIVVTGGKSSNFADTVVSCFLFFTCVLSKKCCIAIDMHINGCMVIGNVVPW